MPASTLIALCTCPDTDTAERLAVDMVAQGLAACVNILPGVRSVYRWQEQVEQADEVQLIIKTCDSSWSQLEQFIQQEHPYQVPELIAVPISAGLPAYLTWLESACVSRD